VLAIPDGAEATQGRKRGTHHRDVLRIDDGRAIPLKLLLAA
jgi:hypothetical protein